MDGQRYQVTTLNVLKEEDDLDNYAFSFISEGIKGSFDMVVTISKVWADKTIFNLGLVAYDPDVEEWRDDVSISNGDRTRILRTTGIIALDWLEGNPTASIIATGSEGNGHLGIRTKMYQRGIEHNFDFLSERHNIYGFIGLRNAEGNLEGDWEEWDGEWLPFVIGTKYDKFMLNLKKEYIPQI